MEEVEPAEGAPVPAPLSSRPSTATLAIEASGAALAGIEWRLSDEVFFDPRGAVDPGRSWKKQLLWQGSSDRLTFVDISQQSLRASDCSIIAEALATRVRVSFH